MGTVNDVVDGGNIIISGKKRSEGVIKLTYDGRRFTVMARERLMTRRAG